MLEETLRADLKEAMKTKDTIKKAVIQVLLSSLKNKAIEVRRDLTDTEKTALIQKEIKQAKESLEYAKKSGRENYTSECEAKVTALIEYLPKQLSEAEVENELKTIISDLGITTISGKEKGLIIKTAMQKIGSVTTGTVINSILTKLTK